MPKSQNLPLSRLANFREQLVKIIRKARTETVVLQALYNFSFWTIKSVRVKGGISLRNGMWHSLRNGIIMRNVIYAE